MLLALCDADKKFIYVSVGVNGRVSDGGVFKNSSLFWALKNNLLNIPPSQTLPNSTEKLPYVIVADDAFTLMPNLMKPYPSRLLTKNCRIFNYRLSRARMCIENAFGILCNRFRILLNTINLSPEKVELIVLTTCVLHNYLISKNETSYLTEDEPYTNNLPSISNQTGNRVRNDAISIRDSFQKYFNNPEGMVPWQDNKI